MTLDAGVHHLGTKLSHLSIPVGLLLIGMAAGVTWLQAFATGMVVVLLFGNMRCRAPSYRWRVRDPGPRAEEIET